MGDLIAILGAASKAWVRTLEATWDDGNAVLPIDPRLPQVAVKRLVAAMKPARIIEISSDGHSKVQSLTGAVPIEAGDALVMPTSGTTGHPKGVILTRDAVAASALATTKRLGVNPNSDHWVACLPLAHVGGLSVVTRALHTQTRLSVLPQFEASAVMQLAEAGATHISLVATALGRISPQGYKKIVLGGAAPPENLPSNVVVTYGMTETGSGVVYDGLPLDGVEIRIMDGEIQLRGPMLLRAYRDGSNPFTPDGWLATNDMGAINPDSGRLQVFGRSGDMIISGGENIWPTPVEQLLEKHPNIAEVCVIGRPDKEWGQAVTAVIALKDGAQPPSVAELRDLVVAELPAFCAPKSVEITDQLPRTALGKIQRNELKTCL